MLQTDIFDSVGHNIESVLDRGDVQLWIDRLVDIRQPVLLNIETQKPYPSDKNLLGRALSFDINRFVPCPNPHLHLDSSDTDPRESVTADSQPHASPARHELVQRPYRCTVIINRGLIWSRKGRTLLDIDFCDCDKLRETRDLMCESPQRVCFTLRVRAL